MEEVHISEEVILYCKSQLKIGCGSCVIRPVCHVSYPITLHHYNENSKKVNDFYLKVFNKNNNEL